MTARMAYPETTADRDGDSASDGPVDLRTLPAREFRLAPELRRSAIWFFVGACVIAATAWTLWLTVDPTPRPPWPVALLIAVSLVPLAVSVRYRVRVDQHGISRRRLLVWATWPWEAFASGKIESGPLYTLSHQDAAWIYSILRRVWVPPPVTPVAEFARTQRGRMFRFDDSGIHVSHKGRTLHCRWDEAELRIIRNERQDPTFKELRLRVPDHELVLLSNHPGYVAGWRSVKAAAVSAFFERHVPADRTVIAALSGPATTAADLEERTRQVERRRKDGRFLKGMTAVCMTAMVVFLLWEAVAGGLKSALALSVMLSIYGVIIWGFLREIRTWQAASEARLERDRAEFLARNPQDRLSHAGRTP